MVASGVNVNMYNDAAVNRDGGVLDFCRLNKITVQPWSPMQYGFFEGCFVDNEKKLAYILEDNNGTRVDYTQSVVDLGTRAIDNSEHTKEYLTVNGCEAVLMRYTVGRLVLLWTNEYLFTVRGENVDFNTLLRGAESLQ